jgi:hypothetical protein
MGLDPEGFAARFCRVVEVEDEAGWYKNCSLSGRGGKAPWTYIGLEDLNVGIIKGDDLFLWLVVHLLLV